MKLAPRSSVLEQGARRIDPRVSHPDQSKIALRYLNYDMRWGLSICLSPQNRCTRTAGQFSCRLEHHGMELSTHVTGLVFGGRGWLPAVRF